MPINAKHTPEVGHRYACARIMLGDMLDEMRSLSYHEKWALDCWALDRTYSKMNGKRNS